MESHVVKRIALLPIFLIAVAGCFSPTDNIDSVKDDQPDIATNQNSADQQTNPNQLSTQSESDAKQTQSFRETISAEKVEEITGQKYHDSRQTADFVNIKHCEHSSEDGQYSVSVLIAFHKTADQRMEQNLRYGKLKPQEDFGDECFWQPDLGMLYAKFGDRYLETRISKSHGSEKIRIELAKEIIQLVLKHY